MSASSLSPQPPSDHRAFTQSDYFNRLLGGFFNFAHGDSLVAEIPPVLHSARDATIVLVGDRDVIFNIQFSQAACKLAKMLHPRLLTVTCLPWDAPGKGADDCRAVIRAGFQDWFKEQLKGGIPVIPGKSASKLAVELLKTKLPTKPLSSEVSHETKHGFAKLIAALSAYRFLQDDVLELGVKYTRVNRSTLQAEAKKIKETQAAEMHSAQGDGAPPSIDLTQPSGTWTTEVLKFLAPSTYVFGANLGVFQEGKFRAFSQQTLPSYIDRPDRCRFIRSDSRGAQIHKSLGESDARLILGAVHDNESLLRTVDVVSQVPLLIRKGADLSLLTGYDRDAKVLVTGNTVIQEFIKGEAARLIVSLMGDFAFSSYGDVARAFSFLITPALVKGRFLGSGRAPFFFISKDAAGAGAGTLIRLMAAIYDARPLSITPSSSQSAREDISRHLSEGASFIYFDNIRGKLLSALPFFESLLTEPIYTTRAPYLHGEVNVEGSVFAATSNNAVLSDDLLSRTVVIHLRKQPAQYKFTQWPEGSLVSHVTSNRGIYLGAIYSLIKAWNLDGSQAGKNLINFRFPEWERACSWMTEAFVTPAPLLITKESQMALCDPKYQMLRDIFCTAIQRSSDSEWTATSLLEIAVEKNYFDSNEKENILELGRILTKRFPTQGQFQFAEFQITRIDKTSVNSNYEAIKRYTISTLPLPGNPR